jgi:TolB-like protein
MDVSALSNEGLTVPAKEKIEGRIIEITTRKKLKALRKWILISTAAIVITLLILFLPGLLKDKMGFTGSEKSIAVLPFENISNDTLQQYFADGITEEIISRLSKIADLKVISRTSVMQYKNTTKNIKLIADELGVAAILEGSVRKDGNKIRITAQLIDANTDKHIWTNTYDENSSEIFTIQSKVAQNIVNELNVKLTTEENKRLTDKATNNVEAYEEFLRAKKLPWTKRIDTLNSVLKKDSTFSLAWAELAATYTKIPYRTQSDKPYYIRKSLDAAFNAVNYGNDRSETHMILGDVLKTITLNPAISINELNKSISLNPNNAEAYVYLAFAQMELGRFAEAEKNLKKARSLDPLSGLMSIGWVTYYRYSRQPEKLLTLKNDIRIENFSTYMDSTLKQWYFFLKDEFDSLLTYKTMGLSTTVMGIAYIRTGQTNNAQHIIDSLVSVSEYDHAFPVGILYAWMGEKQKALDYLNLAYRLYDYGLISIKVDKIFDPLRNEEGFKELLKKMGME